MTFDLLLVLFSVCVRFTHCYCPRVVLDHRSPLVSSAGQNELHVTSLCRNTHQQHNTRIINSSNHTSWKHLTWTWPDEWSANHNTVYMASGIINVVFIWQCRIELCNERVERETLTNVPPTFSLTAMTVEREMMNMNVMVKVDVLITYCTVNPQLLQQSTSNSTQITVQSEIRWEWWAVLTMTWWGRWLVD